MILLCLVLHARAIPFSTGLFGRGNATILVQDFGCTGREESLQQCTPSNYSISSYYSYGYIPNRYVLVPFSLLNISSCYTYNRWFYLTNMVNQPTQRYLTCRNLTSSFQRLCSQCYLPRKHHLPVWVQLWRSSSCWWQEGEWRQSGDLCGGVLGDCVWQWVECVWERRSNSCVQATIGMKSSGIYRVL